MKHLLTILVAALLCVNIVYAQKQTSLKPAGSYRLNGIKFASPDQTGWTLLKSGKTEIVFEKRSENAVSNASVKTFKTETFETEKARLEAFENLKTKELSVFKRDSVHFNYAAFKGTMCLEYDGIFKTAAPPAPRLEDFHIKGYLCPHPTDKNSAVQIEFSDYTNTRDFTEDFISLGNDFFEKVIFSKKR